MPRGASSTRNPSDKATTEYFEAKYGALLIAINPATDAVETICPPSPWASSKGVNISTP